jgi:hypothetical protein
MRVFTNRVQGKRKSSTKPQGTKKARLSSHNPLWTRLTSLTEGEAAHDVPVPLLQPREFRLRLHREEVRRWKPTVQGVRPDIPDEHQLYVVCARLRRLLADIVQTSRRPWMSTRTGSMPAMP